MGRLYGTFRGNTSMAKNGSFEMKNILKVEEQLFKKNARPSQLEAIEWWRKEAHRRQEKEQGKVEKALRMSEKERQKQIEDKGREAMIGEQLRETGGNIAGIYPILPKIDETQTYEASSKKITQPQEWPSAPDDSFFREIMDVPPPYFTEGQRMVMPVPAPGRREQVSTIQDTPPKTSQHQIDMAELTKKTAHLTVGGERGAAKTEIDNPPILTCPFDPLNETYPPLSDEGTNLAHLWRKLEKLPLILELMNKIVEFMLRGGEADCYHHLMEGKTRKQQGAIYLFLVHLFIQHYKAKNLRPPKKVGALAKQINEDEGDEIEDNASTTLLLELLDLINEERPKFREDKGFTRIGAKNTSTSPVRNMLATTLCHPPRGNVDIYEQTKDALSWFYLKNGPLMQKELDLARMAVLWTSRPELFNPDIIAQMYTDLTPTQRLVASLHMTQSLIVLGKQIHPHWYLLESLMDHCSTPGFLRDPVLFLNDYMDARQEYYESQTSRVDCGRDTGKLGELSRNFPIREVHPRLKADGELERIFVYTPLTKLEILKMKEVVPSHSKDPVGFYKELTDILTMGTYTLEDLTQILQKLLPPGIYEQLRGKNWRIDANYDMVWATLEQRDRERKAGADIDPLIKNAPQHILQV
ncbi:hypothetical protein NDU88_006770 [Pleurodeles waltl]|uniref:Uncharacterized protein n=1 Tax=Pleurodeles waltl TaxID=8319 RepID=A0AAV7NVD7_PLEWA|nr:hypothetical protein NDU88_006770 [Pleurodeles waltl]